MSPPLAAIGVKPLQLPSGVGVLPVRTLSATPVPPGVSAVQTSGAPVDRLAGVEDPRIERARGRIGAQVEPVDRDVGAAALRSLAPGRIWVAPKLAAWVATRLPSTKNRTSVASHSIR